MKRKLPAWAAGLAVCACGALLATGVNGLTRDRIEQQAAAAASATQAGVLEAARFEAIDLEESRYGVDAAWAGLDENGQTVGYVGQATVTGYGGPIEVTAGLDMDGAITGVSVGGDAFDETPGLGARTREAAFTDQFRGRGMGVAIGSDGLEAVSGATISSRAVASGVNTVAGYLSAHPLGLIEESAASYEGETIDKTVQGFGGDVTVSVGLADDDSVEYLAIDTPNETDGLGKLASDQAFTGQFIGKHAPFVFGEDGIDAITGATVTSTAVINALNDIVPGGEAAPVAAVEAPAAPEAEPEPADAPETEAPEAETVDVSRFMRVRPASGEPAKAPAGAETDVSRFMRPRPAGVESAGENEAVEADDDVSRFMRPKPAVSNKDEAEPAEAPAGAETDVARFMRTRPATSDESAAEEASAEAEIDASRFMRVRPAA